MSYRRRETCLMLCEMLSAASAPALMLAAVSFGRHDNHIRQTPSEEHTFTAAALETAKQRQHTKKHCTESTTKVSGN